MSDAQLKYLLKSFTNKVEGVESAAIVSREGLIVSAILAPGANEMHIAAMSAIMLSTCERILVELAKGELDVTIVQGTSGKFLIMEAGADYILVAVLSENARMDRAFTEMRQIARQITEIVD
ncbi:MAG: hypothetical protein Kow0069_22770 [Promethearchaeota archaeon]